MHIVRCLPLPLILIAIGMFTSGCATNPATGNSDLVFMSETKEIALGKKYDPEIRKVYGVYNDQALQAYVQQVGEKLATHSHRPGLKYHFTIIDSPEVNAFATPGGYIYVARGILSYFSSEAELAAVLGHELGHVTARHAVRQNTAVTITGIGAAILGGAIGGNAGANLFGQLGNAMLSGYGREHELEADHLGAEYLARTNYDPQAMFGVMTILKNQEEAEKKRAAAEGREAHIYHGVFASHPSADERLKEVIHDARKFKVSEDTRVGREEYLEHVNHLAFGDSAESGVRRGSSFYHRDLKFALSFPDGWQLENSPKSVYAISPDKDAFMQLLSQSSAENTTAREHLVKMAKTGDLKNDGPLQGSAFPSYTAVVNIPGPFGKRSTRITVLLKDGYAYTLYGTAKKDEDFTKLDTSFLNCARSMHTLKENERRYANGLHIKTIKARAGDTFATLAKNSPLISYAELTLRLINNKFPDGEPAAGETIKLVE